MMILCNKFRDSLKPAFKMLCNRVEEVSEDTVDVTEQLNEYIRKDELTRDDVVDVFAKIDNDNHVITLLQP